MSFAGFNSNHFHYNDKNKCSLATGAWVMLEHSQSSVKVIGIQSHLYKELAAIYMYRQVSNIRRTKSQHLKDSRTVLRLSLPNPLKPVVKSRMKM